MNKAEKTKRLILEKASALFNEKGYSETSIADITAAVGLTKGAIYGHFDNKIDIAKQAFINDIKRLENAINKDIESKKNIIEKLLVYSKFFKKNYKAFIDNNGCPLLGLDVNSGWN